ncbi:MAG: GNAT family N-acetyltransferase [Actinobacteria bacterium]|nr:GNAT family N-acetyltransferase [Actinomycetota bacterium]
MVGLVRAHGGRVAQGWWDQIRAYSLGWVTARADGVVIGFVNVAWDGGDHAFLLDTKTHSVFQHRGIGTRLVEVAARHAKTAGCVEFPRFGGHLLTEFAQSGRMSVDAKDPAVFSGVPLGGCEAVAKQRSFGPAACA